VGQPAAKQGDQVVGTDMHIVLVPSPSGPTPSLLPHPFTGMIDGGLSTDVKLMGRPAAVAGATATNNPPHVPTPPGTAFQRPPPNKATLLAGSPTVRINNKPAVRNGDRASTCNDPADMPVGTVIAVGTVSIG
jgi:uncharacterized Zn-binding protein involved in type VI secretion